MCDEKTKVGIKETLRLDRDIYDSLIGIFVRTNLMPESISVFNDYVENGTSVSEALPQAVINEMANIALEEITSRAEFADALIATGERIKKDLNKSLTNNKNKEDSDDNTPEEEISR